MADTATCAVDSDEGVDEDVKTPNKRERYANVGEENLFDVFSNAIEKFGNIS